MMSKNKPNRQRIIIRTSVIGIVTNLVLVAFKMTVGLIAASNAIVLDAVNNLTDVFSSVVTIVGTKLAARRPDREHPYGHGRYEYLAALVVGAIIFSVGAFALVESIPKVFHPELADYSLVSIIVISAAVLVKIFLGLYVKSVGRAQDSASLLASGLDAMFDAVLSFSTLIGIFSTMFFQVSLDGILGVIISLFIIKTSLEILSNSVLDIIGGRSDPGLSRKLHAFVCSFPEVSGAYDLILHDYGPGAYMGSIHIQVPDRLTAKDIHRLTSEISQGALSRYNVTLTVGIYAENSQTKAHQAMRRHLEEIIEHYPAVLQSHGFYVDDQRKLVTFDLVIDYFYREKLKLKNRIVREFRRAYPEYRCRVTLDLDTGLELEP
jgi:cation diffusion facilitator family transporter